MRFFIDVYALVATLTVAWLWAGQDAPMVLRLPRSKACGTYLARMRFFELLPDIVEYSAPPPVVMEHPSPLVPLTPVRQGFGEHGIDELCNFVYPQLPAHLAESFTIALGEIGSNVIHHSQAEVGFVAGQRFERDLQGRKAPRLLLVVGDAGIGIKKSLLQAHPEVAHMTDIEAIRFALEPGVTSKPAIHSGVGLTTVLEYAQLFAGVLRIRSDEGMVVHRPTGERSKWVPGLQGTIVSVELSSPGRE